MYQYDFVPNMNEQFYYNYQQQFKQISPNTGYYNNSSNLQSPYQQYNYQQQQQQHHHSQVYQQQQQQQQQQSSPYISPLISDVKNIWSSALFLPCLYPYLYEPFDFKYQYYQQQQQHSQQQILTSELNALYDFLINDEKQTNVPANKNKTAPAAILTPNTQSNVIRRLNFDHNNNTSNSSSSSSNNTSGVNSHCGSYSDDNDYLNYIKTTTSAITINQQQQHNDATSLSSDDGYQSGSFDNFGESFMINKKQYENLAAVVSNNHKTGIELKDITNQTQQQQHQQSQYQQRNNSTSPKPKFVAPRFEKKWLENQTASTTTGNNLKSVIITNSNTKQQQQQSPKSQILNPNNNKLNTNYANSNNKKQNSPYKRNNHNHHHNQYHHQNSTNNKYQQQQQQQPTSTINYTKRCNKCSLNFIQCTCSSANNKTTLSPSHMITSTTASTKTTTTTTPNKFNRVPYQLKTRS